MSKHTDNGKSNSIASNKLLLTEKLYRIISSDVAYANGRERDVSVYVLFSAVIAEMRLSKT